MDTTQSTNGYAGVPPPGTEQGRTIMQTYRALTPRAHAELAMRASLLTGTKHRAEATRLVEEGRVERSPEDPEQWEVTGRSSGRVYTIRRNTCPCRTTRDGQDTYACAHLAAIYLYKRVEEEMRKEGQPMFAAEETGDENASKTVEDGPGSTNGTDAHVTVHEQEEASTQAFRDEQRHQIRRLLVEFGCIVLDRGKKVTRADYDEACETHVGLSLVPEQFGVIIERLQEMIAARRNALPPPKLLKDYMMKIGEQNFVKYPGLLALAHEKGLCSIKAEFVSVTSDLALATATAIFNDGRTFTEAGDATPKNVKGAVSPHFARMALTRAKARCLRDALNIGEAAAEEVE